MALPAKKAHYTFADYLTWGEHERMELLDGAAVMMAPPSRIHQEILTELTRQLANFLEGNRVKSIQPHLVSAYLRMTATHQRM